MTKSNFFPLTSLTSLNRRKTETGLKPSRKDTRSTTCVLSAYPERLIMSALGLPTATVIFARGKCSRIARKAGRLSTTSPSWPKSITRMFRGSNLFKMLYLGQRPTNLQRLTPNRAGLALSSPAVFHSRAKPGEWEQCPPARPLRVTSIPATPRRSSGMGPG